MEVVVDQGIKSQMVPSTSFTSLVLPFMLNCKWLMKEQSKFIMVSVFIIIQISLTTTVNWSYIHIAAVWWFVLNLIVLHRTPRTIKQTMQENSQENMIMYVSKLTEQVSGRGARVRSCSTLSPFNPFYPQPTPHHHHARTCSTLTWFRLIRVDSRRAYVWVKWFLSSPAATSIDITEASHRRVESPEKTAICCLLVDGTNNVPPGIVQSSKTIA